MFEDIRSALLEHTGQTTTKAGQDYLELKTADVKGMTFSM